MRSLKNFNVFNKKVLVRCDFNVPVDNHGNILDDSKILKVAKTIEYLVLRKASITLMGHLGQVDGQFDVKLKFDKIAKKLIEHINLPVAKAEEGSGYEVERYINSMQPGNIFLLENLKFKNEEVNGDVEFSKKFSFLHEIYINDDFVDCDKFYASITGVPQYLNSGTGLALEEEINNLNQILRENSSGNSKINKPLVVIVGGKSTDVKLKFIDKIANIADWILVGTLESWYGFSRNAIIYI